MPSLAWGRPLESGGTAPHEKRSRTRSADVRQDPDPRAAERDALSQYLDYQRETILLKTEGLTKDQLAQKIPTSDLTLAGLLYHLALVEEAWFEEDFLGHEPREDWEGIDWE